LLGRSLGCGDRPVIVCAHVSRSSMLNRLSLLGPVCLTGREASLMRRASQQRRIALLAVIAGSPGESASRDRLLGLLWPDRDERSARHLLADSLYVLRQTLGDGAIVAAGETLRLAPELVWSDVVEFRRAIGDERWSDALHLYRGDFVDGFFVRNAVDFDQWAMAERSRLRALATRAASALVDQLERAGRIHEAVAAAERALELSPCDESSIRDLVRLLIATGNGARADAVARGFIERLALELGVSPSAETMRLLREPRGLGNTEPIVVVALREVRGPRSHAIDSVTAGIIAQGRFHWHRRTRGSVERAIVYFTRAIERDARAADAWCGLADCWIVMAGRGYVPVAVAIERSAAAADRALALDDTLPAAHISIGGVNLIRRRWSDSEAALRRALLLDPHNADAHHWLSLTLLTGFGARDEAMREQTITASLNPVSPILVGALGWQRYLRGEYELSRSSMEPVVDLNGDLEEAHAGLVRAAARLGDEATVMTTVTAGLTRRGALHGDLLAEQASALAILGDSRRARRIALRASRYEAKPLNLALAWATLADLDRVLQCLAREPFLVYWAPHAVWWDPRFDEFRDDVRFRGVRERVLQAWSPEWL
jgi:DNA-binding SARP family transcriptional activator